MKVLFISRPDVFSQRGGDTIQMEKTGEYLKKVGVNVDTAGSGQVDFRRYDIVHIFNIQNPDHTLHYLESAHVAGKKVAVSTIYWNLESIMQDDLFSNPRFRIPRSILGTSLSTIALRAYLRRIKNKQSQILQRADVLLPNSTTEMEKLIFDFQMESIRNTSVIVPNAVDEHDFADPHPEVFRASCGFERYVLCVARIQRAKNQLNLIKAVKKIGVPLVMIGNVGEKNYLAACEKEAVGIPVRFMPYLPHNKLKDAYAGAACHALPSLRETPGLSSLEAGVCGCPVVMGTEGSQREYFQDFAHYCDPYDVESICRAIRQAMQVSQEKRGGLRRRILDHYTWTITAQKTRQAYERIS